MNSYALTLVLKPDLEEKAREELLTSVKKHFGKVGKEEVWGARDLAYPIKHLTKGLYVHYLFEVEPNKVAPLDKVLKIDEDIIRFLLVKI